MLKLGPADGFDAVLRHGPLPDNGWIAKRIALSRRKLVASPDYLKANGVPRTLGDLEEHRGIIYSNRGAADWRFRHSGRWSLVRPKAALRVNNGILMRDASVAGLGIALLTTFIVHDDVHSGRLRSLDVDAEAESATLFVAYPKDGRASAKVLSLISHLRAVFGSPPYWDR